MLDLKGLKVHKVHKGHKVLFRVMLDLPVDKVLQVHKELKDY